MTCSYSRIFLEFENCHVVKSVFLVDHKQMTTVGDVCESIVKRHDLKSFCKNEKTKYISLWLNNYFLPLSESSHVFSQNDNISIRIEKTKNANINSAAARNDSDHTEKNKQKRKHTESTESDKEDDDAEKLIKAKNALLGKINHAISNVATVRNDDFQQAKLPVSPQTVMTTQQDTEDSDTEDDKDESINTSSTKGKRKRVRKRKRKKTCDVYQNVSHILTDSKRSELNQSNNTTSNKMKNSTVTSMVSGEKSFGSYPGKLQDPKQFRGGFRKMVVCKPEPSEHIRFGDDSGEEANVTQSEEQYQFLNHTPLEQKSVKSIERRQEEDMSCDIDQNVSESHSSKHTSDKMIIESHFVDTNEESNSRRDDERINNSEHCEIQSDRSTDDSGSALSRKLLPNGVTVFTRNRRGKPNQNPPIQLEQRNIKQVHQENGSFSTSSTVSTPLRSQSKGEADLPARKQSVVQLMQQLAGCAATAPQAGQNSLSASQVRTDYSRHPALVGLPKKGDKIAYKVLEMSVNCCPEVSEYKEAVVLSVDKSQMIQLKKYTTEDVKYNKFHLEVEDENGVWTNTDNPEVVTLHLSSLLEPKLLV